MQYKLEMKNSEPCTEGADFITGLAYNRLNLRY